MIFGDDVAKVSSVCTYTDTGVDEQNSATLIYEDGRVAILNSSMLSLSDRKGIIYGTKGFMIVESINNFEGLTVYDLNRREIKHIDRRRAAGMNTKWRPASARWRKGVWNAPQMPHAETICVMKMMDEFILVKLHDIVIVTEHKNSVFKKVKASGAYFYKIRDRGPYYLRSAYK